MELKFTATIRKTGNSYVVTIPADYVNHEMVQEGKEYLLVLQEVK